MSFSGAWASPAAKVGKLAGADGVIDRSQDARHSVGPIGARHRQYVWTSRRGPHLGQRSSATATTGRTYDRKRSDRTRLQKLLQPRGRPHMGPRLRGDDSKKLSKYNKLT